MRKKHSFIFLIVCILLFSSCGPDIANRAVGGENNPNGDFKSFPPNNLITEFLPDLEAWRGASVYTIDMKIDLEEDIVRVVGSEEVIYTNQESVPLDSIYFRLFPNVGGDYLGVSDVHIDGKPVEPTMEFSNTALRLDLQKALAPGESMLINLQFDEVVPSEMGGNYGLYVYIDEILALDAFFPIIPVYNDEGWNVEEPPRNADLIFTDAAFFSVTVDAPEEFVLAAGGTETGRADKCDRQIATFEGGPQRDFYLAASPRFESESVIVGDVTITSYFVDEFRPLGERVLEIGKMRLPYTLNALDRILSVKWTWSARLCRQGEWNTQTLSR